MNKNRHSRESGNPGIEIPVENNFLGHSVKVFLVKLIASFFFIGYLPIMPGTFGSLAGIFIYYFVNGDLKFYFAALSVLLLLGFVFSGKMEQLLGRKDPGCIVIDEVCGMLITFFLIPLNIKLIFLGFLFFRILDTLKPYPCGKLQHIKGSLGVMSDDLIAGIYANIALQIAIRISSY